MMGRPVLGHRYFLSLLLLLHLSNIHICMWSVQFRYRCITLVVKGCRLRRSPYHRSLSALQPGRVVCKVEVYRRQVEVFYNLPMLGWSNGEKVLSINTFGGDRVSVGRAFEFTFTTAQKEAGTLSTLLPSLSMSRNISRLSPGGASHHCSKSTLPRCQVFPSLRS